MSFEAQELLDIIRVVVLLSISRGTSMPKALLKEKIDRICSGDACVDVSDLDEALEQMASDGLVLVQGDTVHLSEQGVKLGKEWRSLLLKKEPILEVVAGVTDGSITGLMVILSAIVAGLSFKTTTFAAFLTLAAVAITNFSSFLLGGITEDLADMMTLQRLMHYSLSDIADGNERDKSLLLVKRLFSVLHREISRSNLYAAVICSTSTFLTGVIPLIAYMVLPKPFDIILSLGIVVSVIGVFLVRYRAKKTKVHWKMTLAETMMIVAIAVVASLLLGGGV